MVNTCKCVKLHVRQLISVLIDVYPVSLSEAEEHLLRDIEALNLSIKLLHVRLQMSRLIQH